MDISLFMECGDIAAWEQLSDVGGGQIKPFTHFTMSGMASRMMEL
ncbi:MAG TPA: hypothetical protein VFS04_02690 [Alphaproteobacteria bacterium]|nr:hypothetical protein [Alphaproteobacteria bacterium]